MTKVDLFHNLRVKFNELSLREYTIVEEVIEELQGETEATKELEKEAKERAKDYTENKERQVAYECGFLDGADVLEKENAELKKDKEELCHSINEAGKACVNLNERISKAKGIIRQLLLLPYANNEEVNADVTSIFNKAENFLKE